MTTGRFVHLHNHSEYSLLDGAQTVEQMAARAAEIGTPAISITDHGRMGGILSFYDACQKHDVKPIIGMEAYITGFGRSRRDRTNYQQLTKPFQGTPKYERNNYHLILLCKDYRGYENLCALSKESFESGYYYKPRIDYEVLEKYHEGLIATSACIIGTVSNLLLNQDYDKARQVASWFKETFGDDYYLEVMNHNLDIELQVMQDIRNLGKELDIPVVATNDAHYTTRADHDIQKTLMLIGMHKSWADSDVSGYFFKPGTTEPFDHDEAQEGIADSDSGETDPIFETEPELYLKDYDEMLEALRPNGGDNGVAERELAVTLDIAAKCNCKLPIIDPSDMSQYKMPVYNVKKDLQYDDYVSAEYEVPQHTKDAIVAGMHEDGKKGDRIEDFLNAHEMESLGFVMWLCEKGLQERVMPKIRMRGKPLPMEEWMTNPPEGFHVNHAHNSPDETWLTGLLAQGKTEDDIVEIYRKRLDYEVEIVCRKKFLDYFELVQQYANYVRIKGSQIGPARGSGAGSLLNYLIGITSLDPMPNNLMFERFMNPDRNSVPDIDLDFTREFRDDALWPYLREVYGKDNTAQVATYGIFRGKAALKAAGRVLFHKPDSIDIPDQLCNLIDDAPKLDLHTVMNRDDNPEFMDLYDNSLKARQVIELALKLQGRVSGESQHASAYIIAPEPITDKVPMMVSKEEREKTQKTGQAVPEYLIQIDGEQCQGLLGLVKCDLLAIKDLEVLKIALDIVERVYGSKINIENIPLDDKSVFEMVSEGKNRGIFQFDGSSTAIRILKESKANSISDWSSVNALNRPGPLQMGYDADFVRGKLHPETVTYFTPAAKPYLEDTYGVCITQEQLMRLSQDKRIVGFTGGESDNMRKVLAHKKQDQIDAIVKLAHERAEENGVPKQVVDTFCDIAKAAGSYSFNACVTSDTLLYRANACYQDKKYPQQGIPVAEVYRRFNASAARNSPDRAIRSKYRSPNPNRGLFIMCRDADGRSRKHKVKNVWQQGIRPVFKLTLDNGKSIKATANHRFQSAEGYKRVDELTTADSLWCCDFEYQKEAIKPRAYNFSDIHDGNHKGSRGIGKHRFGDGTGEDNPMYTNGGYTAFMKYRNSFDANGRVCECCGRVLPADERYETHHVDGDRTNNDPSNLQNLCVSCHKKADYAIDRVRHEQKGYPTYLSRIVSIEPAGEEMVYDVEIESEEHNFFANGICSHNSHSMAYALIAYRGAFLKAHFPEAFLSALCQIKPKMKKKDKIPDYLEDARQLGVTVRPPHVNWSRAAFDVPEKHVIAYGLNRIPNVGAAADLIVAEREKNGPFTSITDFCCRVPRAVSKGAIHFLIDAGALDGLGWTRMALEDSLDYLVEFRKGWFDDQEAREKRFDLSAMSDDDGTLDLFGGAPSQAMPAAQGMEPETDAAVPAASGIGTTVSAASTGTVAGTSAAAPQSGSQPAPHAVSPATGSPETFVPDRKSGDPFWAVPPNTPVIDHGVTIQPPHNREYTSRALVRKQFDAFGMYFDGSPEDYTQVSRRFMDDELTRQHAAERREGREQYRLVNISDIDRLPDKTRVEFTARIDAVPDRKHRDASGKPTMMSFRPYKSGKGATVFLVDWGVAEESRFGFSPTSYRMSLKCSSRVWDKMVTPQQDQIVHVKGSVSKDPEGKWPTGVWCDYMEVLDDDATFSRGNEMTAAEVQREIARDKERMGRPDSDAYLIPRLTFASEEALEGFVRDPEVPMRYEDLHGRVLLSVAGDGDGKFDRMRNLRQTRGMVAYAVQTHGAKVDKVLLPKAKAEAERRF